MATHANDNEELSFITIGAATLNVIRYLENKRQDSANEGSERTEKEDEKRKRDAIEERVAAIEKFERIARGEDRPRRKRKQI